MNITHTIMAVIGAAGISILAFGVERQYRLEQSPEYQQALKDKRLAEQVKQAQIKALEDAQDKLQEASDKIQEKLDELNPQEPEDYQ